MKQELAVQLVDDTVAPIERRPAWFDQEIRYISSPWWDNVYRPYLLRQAK